MTANSFLRRYSLTARPAVPRLPERPPAGGPGVPPDCRLLPLFRSSSWSAKRSTAIDRVQIVCNSDLDPRDIRASRTAREAILKEKWNEGADEIDSLLHRTRYQRLYELLTSGKVKVRVVSAADAPFLHGKAGVIVQRDGSASAFLGSLNETREGWNEHYELVWEDTSPEGVAWVEAEFDYLWKRGVPSPTPSSRKSAAAPASIESSFDELEPR